MKIQTKSTRCLEARKPSIDKDISKTVEKRQTQLRPMFIFTGLALCMALSSCFASYDDRGYGRTATYNTGYRVNALPGGYRSEMISGNTYYYHDGYYYRPSSNGYVIVEAPRSSRYYADYGRRHQARQLNPRLERDRNDQRYLRGDVLTRLPRGYRVVNHRGARYYQVGERFYQRQNNTYVVVSRPY